MCDLVQNDNKNGGIDEDTRAYQGDARMAMTIAGIDTPQAHSGAEEAVEGGTRPMKYPGRKWDKSTSNQHRLSP